MGIVIYWDYRSVDGIQLPVQRIISAAIGYPVELILGDHFPVEGYHRIRRQYDGGRILNRISLFKRMHGLNDLLLLVIPDDIYADSSDFVFGLARESIGSAVVSTARLRNEFYGLPEDIHQIIERTAKEGAHELGHLMGLQHCLKPECIMYRPESLSELDRKERYFCPDCRSQLPLMR
ncbi:archaemetzincin family Zn-dependent metalloprotease [Methanocalculus taiwanensis]|uniref:Archaemetzincin family Zn-dependent metalloprotease n=1 Tax=Methanocalculus taiwanensis TaxID=106207 RepID=A0ABD4TKV3_9EURY|nr:archaemetzincin family Zn-dependent metalloprotease [Methanocalculus taiwanensis]MCQ1538922.1 archaemetzincin family Zn-dependent metalloprotease [Methanocalculus taiwanensis]